jgi:hypothetical protein
MSKENSHTVDEVGRTISPTEILGEDRIVRSRIDHATATLEHLRFGKRLHE